MNPYNDRTMHLMLMVTYSCNLRCIYCYENHRGDKMISISNALQYIERCFHKAKKNPKYEEIEIAFMGGEPLLEWNTIKQIVEAVESRDDWPLSYHFFSSTNGTLLNDEMKQWIDKRKEYFILGISIDGNCSMQDCNRSNSSSQIDLDYFRSTWPKQGNKMTVSHDTLPNLAEGIMYLHDSGFLNVSANLAMGQEWELGDLTIYAQQLEVLIEYYTQHPSLKRCSLLNIDLLTVLNLSGERRKYCGCGESIVCVDVDGTEYPCHMFAPITIDCLSIDYMRSIDFTDHSKFISEQCGACLLHNHCPRCYGMSYKQKKDVQYQDSFMCKAFKIQFLSNCRLAEIMLERNPNMNNALELSEVLQFVRKYLFK